MKAGGAAAAAGLFMAVAAQAAEPTAQTAQPTAIRIAYLSQVQEIPPALSNLEEPPADEGAAGADLALADNVSTGRFLNQTFALDKTIVDIDGDVAAAFASLRAAGHQLIVLDLPGGKVAELARRPDAAGAVLFNGASPDDDLRGKDCAVNLLHTMPSRAMLADGLAQYLAVKRWSKWFLMVGPRAEDAAFADAIKKAAKKFGAKIVTEKRWSEDHDARRTAQGEIPVFTQGASYDVVIVADEIGDFGDYVLYRTWDPRPVAGTQGLVPTAWSKTHEQWGAAQLQSRFKKLANRPMTPRDWGVWAAVRAVGEAATRTKSADPAALAAFITGPDMALAGFKGVPLTFRPWDGQLRQPVLLAADRSLVSVSPQDGFLHPKTPLDSLGTDEPETRCRKTKK
jgi:ABC transporter substrate binding protein (PQQ-dependent alcohol dehydrogenase system)